MQSRLLNITRLGTKSLSSLLAFARNPRNVELVNQLLVHVNVSGTVPDVEPAVPSSQPKQSDGNGNGNSLQGKVILFTGKAKKSKLSRAAMIKACEELGAKCVSRFSKDVNLLVDCNESGVTSSKSKSASERGIEVWNEEDLLDAIIVQSTS